MNGFGGLVDGDFGEWSNYGNGEGEGEGIVVIGLREGG